MVSLGLSDDVIIEKIRSVPVTSFDTSVAGLKVLKAAKVSDAVLKAMINPHGSPNKTTGKTAEQDNGFAENNTGYKYLRGLSVAQDYQQALVWFRKAADEHNNPSAEQNLGWMHEHGLGVAQNYQEAVTWYRKAAEQGHVGGQCALAWMYQHGLGVAQDDQQAASWYRKAAEHGDLNAEDQPGLLLAENQLGMLYKEGGNGLPRDDQQSAMWFQKAADQGDALSELNLGWMYANGRGVAQDYQQALSWYKKAANQGKDVQPYLNELPSAVREQAGQLVSTSTQQTDAAHALPPSTTLQIESQNLPPGEITGKIFLITQGGDLKPARLAQVVLLYGGILGGSSDTGTASIFYYDKKIENMKASHQSLVDPTSSCLAELLVFNSTLKSTLEWGQTTGKAKDQIQVIDSDEEGGFHFPRVQSGEYTLVAWGHAGANSAYWEESLKVEPGQAVLAKLASPHAACLD